ncbi:MAG: DUF3131 domain-containing protein [Oscillospiraceae bacterium]|jgi:cyclic beta-1,2-glucan synthetase|nr:DUF3131 domain-containing protein [Oscillospiraceae bacterium]
MSNATERKTAAELRRALRTLQRVYLRAVAKPTPGLEWLLDNYYLLRREGAAAVRDLRGLEGLPTNADETPRLSTFFAQYCRSEQAADTDALSGALATMELTASEADALRLFYTVALLLSACRAATTTPADEKALGYAVKSLRALDEIDFEALAQSCCAVDALFRGDPAGVYPQMDEGTRALYRRQVAREAAKRGEDERVYARQLLETAQAEQQHIGHYLPQKTRELRGWVFLALEGIVALSGAFALAMALRHWLLTAVFFLPLWEIVRLPLERLSLRGVPPTQFPRMEADSPIACAKKTLIVVSNILPDAKNIHALGARLQKLAASNGAANTRVCMLLDHKPADAPDQPGDEAAKRALRRLFAALERKAPGMYFLALRPRRRCKTQSNWAGWERKRGATLDLLSAMGGDEKGFSLLLGDRAFLRQTDYLLALDADTQLPFDTARDFVAVAAHPLNAPVIDPQKRRVVAGYGLLVPHLRTQRGVTPFARLLSGLGGFSAYDTGSNERYQDLFGAGIFAGKGLIDVRAATALLPSAFPPGRVLSHDILEGGILRVGAVSSLSMADAFPGKAGAYFARLNRWIRGDAQNVAELTRDNGLPKRTRWQLADNLRRALTPLVALLAVLLSMLLPDPAAHCLLLAGCLTACCGELWSALVASGHAMALPLLGQSTAGRSPVLSALTRALVHLCMLPATAWTCLVALCQAAWRLCVTRKELLAWRTAAQSEGAAGAGHLLPGLLVGLVLLVFGGMTAKVAGVLFLLYLPFAWLSGQEKSVDAPALSSSGRDTVQGYAAAAWRFFEEHVTAAHNHLPPDNVQETPLYAVAARTSPTNMGLYLLSCLGARDLGLIDSAELSERLENTLTSMEQLDRWHGHLLNWYNTDTLAPLHPRYVSTVDSGNLLCAVTALRQGLGEYLHEETRLRALLPRLEALTGACDLARLYNPRRRLFSIGYDLEKEQLSGSYYDLFMSEARMTGYLAVARRIVPKKHWGAMGRLLARGGGLTGALSWTGTMFEYFMPQLFLPAPRGTFTRESLAFCLRQQMRRTRRAQLPWGISESGFFAFDPALNYQYKAHGVQKLGLKRGLDAELVIAPYASFLCLPYAPRAALKNLATLEKMGLAGSCGFYEAADCTRARTAGQDYAIVRSYMAHHVGMSFLSCVNALTEQSLQKRFLRDSEMGGAVSLLEESVPEGALLYKHKQLREIPQPRARTQEATRVIREPNPAQPQVHILTSGEYTGVYTDVGAGTALYAGANVTRHSADLLQKPVGVLARFVPDAAESGKGATSSLPFTRLLGEAKGCRFSTQFARESVTYTARNAAVRMTTRAAVHPRLPGEKRTYKLRNQTAAALAGKLHIYLEPSLIPQAREDEHPAFAKLFVTEEHDAEHNVLLFTRAPRGKETGLCLAVGLAGDETYGHSFVRGECLGTSGVPTLSQTNEADCAQRGNPDTCAHLVVPLTLPPKGTASTTLILCVAATRREALRTFLRAREPVTRYGTMPFTPGGAEDVLARRLLPRLFYRQGGQSEGTCAAIRENTLRGRGTLWSLGISGDAPIVYLPVADADDAVRAVPYLHMVRRLAAAGVRVDLVLAGAEGGDYAAPLQSALTAQIRACGLENAPNVFTVNTDRLTSGEQAALKAAAVYFVPREAEALPPPAAFQMPETTPVERAEFDKPETHFAVHGGTFGDGAFFVGADKPARPWCWTLANAAFGTLVSEKSLGYTWAVNCRENRLTPWDNDVCTDNRGERLIAKLDGKTYDLLQGAACAFRPEGVTWQGDAGGVRYTVALTVPARGMVKNVQVTLHSPAARRMSVVYYTEPLLATGRSAAGTVQGEPLPDGALLWNLGGTVPGTAALQLAGGANILCFDRSAFWGGQWHTGALLPQRDPCAAVGRTLELESNQPQTLAFSLAWSASREAARLMPRVQKAAPPSAPRVWADKAEGLDVLQSGFLQHQVRTARLWGRTGFQQSSGAYGFRDQLQDACGLVWDNPELLARQIARCCAVQFPEGDVLHWWHRLPGAAGGLRGVRTRCSDDMLWLPYALAHYLECTGDDALLHKSVRYLEGEMLRADEDERYFSPVPGTLRESIYRHALRALQICRGHSGARGLPLMGTGDWNDSFNELGAKGRGESVWLGMFLALTSEKFAPLCEKMQDAATAQELRRYAGELRETIDRACWDGDHYLRGWYDDGTPLGARGDAACAIDSLTQSFAVLADIGDEHRRREALQSAYDALVDHEHRLVRLFTPAFDGQSGRNPGYAASYPPGIRENGGQYTHAVPWLAMAFARAGQPERAREILRLICPAEICRTPAEARRYQGEPYAMAGDVSAAPGMEGRAGWGLYTGSAAWMLRALRGFAMNNGQ